MRSAGPTTPAFMKQLAFDLADPPPPTLENFVGGLNTELLQHLRQVAAGDPAERNLYLWGPFGCGRSHLLRGTVAAACRAGTRAAYIACAPGTRLPERVAGLDCVALDDVGQLDAQGQIEAFHLYNALRERGGGLLAAGELPPVQLQLREDLVTRFGWGLVYQVHALTDENKARALVEHAATRGFRLQPEVCEFLLSRGRRDMPSLLATLEALDRYSLETKRPVTVPLLRDLLAQAADREGGIRDAGPGTGT
jgi:DnaA-homolog protein